MIYIYIYEYIKTNWLNFFPLDNLIEISDLIILTIKYVWDMSGHKIVHYYVLDSRGEMEEWLVIMF